MELILHFPGRPPTHNAKRYQHWSKAGETTRIYRTEARLKSARKPVFTNPVIINVAHHCRDNRLPDAGSAFDVAKAIVDGVVDAGLLPDDGPRFVKRYELEAPVNTGEDRLIITIREVL